MPRRFCFAAIVVTALSACVTTNATMLDATAGSRPSVPAEQVKIYRTPSTIPGPYTEIAILAATGESHWTNEQGMFEALRRKAGKVGGNGVLLDGIQEASAGAKVAAAVFGTGTERKGRAVAIWVTDTTSRELAAPTRQTADNSLSRVRQTPVARAVANGDVPLTREAGTATKTPTQRPNVAPTSPVVAPTEQGSFAEAKIGAPRTDRARDAAAVAFKRGQAYLDRHQWPQAEAAFREALSLDGSVASYHGALGDVLMVAERWADAEAEFSAAMLLDVDNADYRTKLKTARSRR